MKKIITCIALGMTSSALMAQETYESAQLATQDLNGTARYVGMGGALEALGADISTINTNPAGVGLFRRGWVGVSAGVTSQAGDNINGNQWNVTANKNGITNVDLNQIGIVFSSTSGSNSYLNFAVNYQKSRNFNQIINAVNSLNDASLNKLSALRLSQYQRDTYSWTKQGYDSRWEMMSLVDDMNYIAVNDFGSGVWDDGNYRDTYMMAKAYCGQQKNEGFISNFDFNVSGNIDNRIFLGLTFGIKDVHYNNHNYYDELLLPTYPVAGTNNVFSFCDDRRVRGSGFDVKVGAIFRPIETSPFRIGLYVNSPVWYDLKCDGRMSSSAEFYQQNQNDGTTEKGGSYKGYDYSYDYRIVTPWKFGASLGTTVGNKLAIGATYEYSDYSSIKNRVVEGDGYSSYYDPYYDSFYTDFYRHSTSDNQMNRNTEKTLKGVSLLKVGMELKPVPTLALRAGYNYQSAIYSANGYKDMMGTNANVNNGSVGSYYSSYDYVNWKDTHRLTFGIGLALTPTTSLDFSYQYSTQKGDYHPFQDVNPHTSYMSNDLTGVSSVYTTFDEDGVTTYGLDGMYDASQANSAYGNPTTVKNNRHQFNMTLSYKF